MKSFLERLDSGETLILGAGYLFEFERRGYLKAGSFVPEVVVEQPHLVRFLHEEYVHAGSDIVQAFTYYAHRAKLRLIGREADLEPLNRGALSIAKDVATATGKLFAGGICNTTLYVPEKKETHEEVRAMYKESVTWANEAGVDLMVAESLPDLGEALLALEAIKAYAPGVPAVINLWASGAFQTRDGVAFPEALRRLWEAGAEVVGLNCLSGPSILGPRLGEVRAALPQARLSCLPVPYRTKLDEDYLHLKVEGTGEPAFPASLDAFYITDAEVRRFGAAAKAARLALTGFCCGNSARYMRALAESLGKRPPASRFSPDMSQHWVFGDDDSFQPENRGLFARSGQ